ncbi:MAG: formate dehydrogenase accessory sulfurtransferase FdhD [Thermoanaerobaculia bacterium]
MPRRGDRPPGAAAKVTIRAIHGGSDPRGRIEKCDDLVAVEEPLEIRLFAEAGGSRRSHRYAVTMRSPGHDAELACGLLLAEGIVSRPLDIWRTGRCEDADAEGVDNTMEVHLAPGVGFDPEDHRRSGYTSSSCGVCGKESIEQLKAMGGAAPVSDLVIAPAVIRALPEVLRSAQSVFAETGGLHACGLFSGTGELELLREDVGRHNALDKVIGRLLLDDRLPASDSILLVSGRAGFELVHKAMAGGIAVMLAVGAPSSLAIETAEAFGMTLSGFVRDGRFNVYTGGHRIRS